MGIRTMIVYGNGTLRFGIVLGALVGLVGCAEESADVEGNHDFAFESENGLQGYNGLPGSNGLPGANGLTGANGLNGANGLSGANGLLGANGLPGANGLSGANGLPGANGLSETSGLITTDAGRKTIAYLVRCALPSGHSITKAGYTFQGSLG